MASEYEFADEEPLNEEFSAIAGGKPIDGGRSWGNLLAGAAVGLLVGGGLALLYAPKRGTDLRSELGEAVETLRDRAEKTLDDLQEASADLLTRSRELVEQTRENIVRSVEAGRDAYQEKKEELTAQMEVGSASVTADASDI